MSDRMDEAKRRLALSDFPATGCIADTMTEAHRLARNAVKEQWRAQGLRPQAIETGELTKAARAYFDQHRDELVSRACANLLSRAQRGKA